MIELLKEDGSFGIQSVEWVGENEPEMLDGLNKSGDCSFTAYANRVDFAARAGSLLFGWKMTPKGARAVASYLVDLAKEAEEADEGKAGDQGE